MPIIQTPFFIKLQKRNKPDQDDLENIIDGVDEESFHQVKELRKQWITCVLLALGVIISLAVIIIIVWTFAYPVMKNV